MLYFNLKKKDESAEHVHVNGNVRNIIIFE